MAVIIAKWVLVDFGGFFSRVGLPAPPPLRSTEICHINHTLLRIGISSKCQSGLATNHAAAYAWGLRHISCQDDVLTSIKAVIIDSAAFDLKGWINIVDQLLVRSQESWFGVH
jgi:hypothetical protein